MALRLTARLACQVGVLLLGFWPLSASLASPLGASDVAILYPLKATAEPNELFPVPGDGLCNAPSLADTLAGGDQPLMSPKDFNYLIDRIFGVQAQISPPDYLQLPDGDLTESQLARKRHYARWTDLAAAQANRRQQLAATEEAYATTDYPAPLFCHQPSLAGGIAELSDDYQLELGHHLVQSEGVLNKACDYGAWRVVAIRFNPCLEQAEIPDFWQHDELPAECRTREFRLVLQPVNREDGRIVVADLALHFIYQLELDQMRQVIAALRQLKARKVDDPTKPNSLEPHPGLVTEMNRCDGQVANRLRQLILRAAVPDQLASVAWMSSSASQSRWSFGSLVFGDQTSEDDSLAASISMSELSKRVDRFPFAFRTMEPHLKTIAKVYHKPFRNPPEPITAVEQLAKAKRLFDQLDAIENPTMVSQVAMDPHRFSSDCVSCHMVSQSRKRLSAAVAGAVASTGAHSYLNQSGQKAEPWPLLPSKRQTNFRNFGYGPGSSDRLLPAISQRVSHEALNISDVVAKFFGSSGYGSSGYGSESASEE